MTTISLVATDQLLSVALQPKVASGDQNSVELHVDFDSEWDGYGKSAVFFTSENNTVYEMVLTNGNCVIPHEVLAKPCDLYIGVRGVNSGNNAVKTSSLVKYKIIKGAPAGDGATVEPTADVYQQLLTAITVLDARFNQFMALPDGSTTGDAALADICVGYNGKEYETPGEAVRGQASELKDDLNAVYNLLEIKYGKNILDPANSESGYYIRTTGQPLTIKASTNHLRTVTPIPVEEGEDIYPITNLPAGFDGILVAEYLDADLNSLGGSTRGSGSMNSLTPVNGAKFVHFWINDVADGVTFENWCISREPLDEFEPYSTGGTITGIKPETLPPELFEHDRPLAGKTIVNFGDSIFGKRRPPNDISTELARLTGATVHNCGFGGCRMAKHGMTNFDAFSMYRLADSIVSGDWSLQDAGIADRTHNENVPSYFTEGLAILKGLDFANVDIITIAYGTNDFTGNIGLENPENAKDTTKFAGALRYSVETLLNAYPHLKIFVCSQAYRFWMDANNVFTEDSDTKMFNGVKLTDFVAKTSEVAKEYHLPYINNYDIGMNKYNRSYYFGATDGTHPLTTGCHLIAQHIAKELF